MQIAFHPQSQSEYEFVLTSYSKFSAYNYLPIIYWKSANIYIIRLILQMIGFTVGILR